MSNDLVDRLRARTTATHEYGRFGWEHSTRADADCHEAADAIERQTARIADLEAALEWVREKGLFTTRRIAGAVLDMGKRELTEWERETLLEVWPNGRQELAEPRS